MATIQELKTNTNTQPYTKTLRVFLAKLSEKGWVRYTSAKGQSNTKLTLMVADSTGYMKGIAYNERFRSLLHEGYSVALRNFIVRDGLLRITTKTTVMRYVCYLFCTSLKYCQYIPFIYLHTTIQSYKEKFLLTVHSKP